MTILRLDTKAGGWRPVSPLIFEDKRLSLDTRAVAGFISTRNDTFDLNVAGLRKLLSIGEEKWRRMNDELTDAGYLKRSAYKDNRGRFCHELVFSPIPDNSVSKTLPDGSSSTNPKKRQKQGTAKPGMPKPRLASPRSTNNLDNQISDHHHQDGGGIDSKEATPPSIWIKAANYEISVLEQTEPIRKRGALLNSIYERYRSSGGPDAHVISALKKIEEALERQAADAAAALDRLRADEERTRIAAQRHATAENHAKSITPEDRAVILSSLEKSAPIKASEHARTAFAQHGKIMRGTMSHALVEYLVALRPNSYGGNQ